MGLQRFVFGKFQVRISILTKYVRGIPQSPYKCCSSSIWLLQSPWQHTQFRKLFKTT